MMSSLHKNQRLHLLFELCHGRGYEQQADEKATRTQIVASKQIGSLGTMLELVELKTNGASTAGRKLSFAIIQNVKQQARLELIGNVRAGKAVDKSVDSHFFKGKSIRRHDEPPRRQMGLESLAVPTADSSRFQLQASSELVCIHKEMSGEQKCL